MNFIKERKNQILLLIIAVIGLTMGIIGFSFAIFSYISTNTNDQTLKTGDLNVIFKEGQTITGSMKPMSNLSGLNQEGYSFEVKNEGTLAAKYTIKIKRGVTNTIDLNELYISTDGSTPLLISDLTPSQTDNSIYIIRENIPIGINEANNHTIKIWIREDAEENISNRIISLIMEVESVVND